MIEPEKPGPSTPYDDEIDLRELFRVLRAGKWLIGGITLAATVIAVIVALMLPNIYRAQALLAPSQAEGAGGLFASEYRVLANVAGFNIAGGSVDKTALGLEVLKSRKFVSELIERHDILVPLMASTGWNAESGELKIDPDVYDTESDKWVRNVRPPKKAAPSSQEAYRAFSEKLSVSQNRTTSFVTVAIEHYSPTVAKQWVDWLVDDLNSSIMHKDVEEAEQAIEYLKKQIDATSLADLQNVFFRLIEEQTKTVMLAKVSPEYMFRTLDPAVAPELKAKPKRSLIAISGMLLGGMVGVFVVFFRNFVSVGRK